MSEIEVVRALSLWQPWAWAVASGHKRIENRGWKPRNAVGTWVAIHAAARVDKDAMEKVRDVTGREPRMVHGALIGVARLEDVIPGGGPREDALPDADRIWFTGPYGWFFDRAIEFAKPIDCRGYQSLWFLKPAIRRQIQQRLDPSDSPCIAPPTPG